MVKTRRNNNLNLYTILNNGLFSRLAYGHGMNLFLLDTETFIELEKDYFGLRRIGNHPAALLSDVEKEYKILVVPAVMREISDHRDRNIKINYRDEISESIAILANKLYLDTVDFLEEENTLDKYTKDSHRLCTRLAAYEAFKNDSRKGEKDNISLTDLEIICTALDLCLCNYCNNQIEIVNIISGDSHISRTVNYLKKPLENSNGAISCKCFRDYGIRVINTRNNLGSYMS